MLSGICFCKLGNNSTRANKIEAVMARDTMVVIRAFLVLGGEEERVFG